MSGHKFKKGEKNPGFKKGQSGNPGGRPSLSTETRLARKMSLESYVSHLSQLIEMPHEELEKIAADKKQPMMKIIIAKFLIDGAKNNNYHQLEKLTERMWGKVPDAMSVSGNLNTGLVGLFEQLKNKGSTKQIEKEVDEIDDD